jgi:hypothetical protein
MLPLNTAGWNGIYARFDRKNLTAVSEGSVVLTSPAGCAQCRLPRTGVRQKLDFAKVLLRQASLIQMILAVLTLSEAWASGPDWNGWSTIWTNPADPSEGIDIHYREEHRNNSFLAQWDWQLLNRCSQNLSIHFKWKDRDGAHDYWETVVPGQTAGHNNFSGIYPEVEIVEVKVRGQGSQSGNVIVFPGKKQ